MAALNVVALGMAFGLFVWANTRPEMLIIEPIDGYRYNVNRLGPGWPVRAWSGGNPHGSGTKPALAQEVLHDPFAEGRASARADAWVVNAPVGGLLLVALVLNLLSFLRPELLTRLRSRPFSACYFGGSAAVFAVMALGMLTIPKWSYGVVWSGFAVMGLVVLLLFLRRPPTSASSNRRAD
jgi:hypothetical protein